MESASAAKALSLTTPFGTTEVVPFPFLSLDVSSRLESFTRIPVDFYRD